MPVHVDLQSLAQLVRAVLQLGGRRNCIRKALPSW